MEANTDRFFAMEQHSAARLIANAVTRHIDDIAGLLAGTRRETLRRRLAMAGGQTAALAGWLAFDQGDAVGAHRYWDSALAAARYAADGPLLACVLTYMSYSAAERGDPAAAWQLAHTAIGHSRDDARAHAWMAACAAVAAARLKDPAAARAELQAALGLRESIEEPPEPQPSLPWARFFGSSALDAAAAHVHGILGDADAAFQAAEQALETAGKAKAKWRAVVLAESACAAARVGQFDLLARIAIEGADLADALECTPARRRLRAVLPLLGPHRTSAQLRGLVDRLEIR